MIIVFHNIDLKLHLMKVNYIVMDIVNNRLDKIEIIVKLKHRLYITKYLQG